EAAERSERVAELLNEANRLLRKGQDFAAVDAKRVAALALFDQRENAKAEELWREVLSDSKALDANYTSATQPLEHASVVDPSRGDVRAELAKVLHLRAQLADRFYNIERRNELLSRLELYDTIGEYIKQWRAPADLTFQITPSNAVMTIATISSNDGRRIEGPAAPFDRSASLPPGSYMFTVKAPGYSPVRYPMVLQASEKLTVPITLVPADKVPADFVVIPAGRFMVGALDEAQRTSFLFTVPLHVVRTDTFMIAKHETTFGEWIEFLRSRSMVERKRLRPHTDGVNTESGWLDLSPTATGWLLRTKPVRHEYVATAGQPLQYLARKFNQAHDWSQLPVTGVSMDDVVEY
ncbi:MAG TPA: SUMF1/EgtB/PvdO family nonheme iron enzyme, partial [Kofleriaceae bacterium]|nr:SUMF1/EgtB/PvdO family nonheme iron enzyme [Kofleriaceae bacterium]